MTLLDIPRMLGMDWLPDGFGITNDGCRVITN